MDFETYFDRLILREGDWLLPARGALKPFWPQVHAELDRASLELSEDVFGKANDDDLPRIDEWFYRSNSDLDNRRPIDLIAAQQGVLIVRALLVRMSAGVVG